jgi:hypothetical protein
MFLRILFNSLVLTATLGTGAFGAQLDVMSVPVCRPLYAEPVDRNPSWPAGHYFRVVFKGIASDTIIVNGYRADIVMLDNSGDQDTHYAIARLPADAAVTKGFITFMVAAKTPLGYTPAVPLKITLL